MKTEFDIHNLLRKQRELVEERDWGKFHTPKNLSMALIVEASELAEIFQWLSCEESYRLSDKKKKEVEEEVADVFYHLLRLCDVMEIDLQQAFLDKLEKTKHKYPVEKSKGNAKKYDEL